MTTEAIALVPYVLHVGESHHPWRAAPIEPLKVVGDTPSGVRVEPGTLPGVTARPGHGVLNRPHHLVHCLATEGAWTEAQQVRDAWQAGLDALAGALREQGRYDERLAAAGKGAANPLTRNVIHLYLPPDRRYSPTYFWTGDVLDVRRALAEDGETEGRLWGGSDALLLMPGRAGWGAHRVPARCGGGRPAGVAGAAGAAGHLRRGAG